MDARPISEVPDFEARLAVERRQLLFDRTRLLLRAGGAIYGSFTVTDWFVAPQIWSQLAVNRALTLGVFALAYLATATKLWERASVLISMSFLWATVISISVMTGSLTGFGHQYYVGILATQFAGASFLPWSPRETGSFMLVALLSFVGINFYLAGIGDPVTTVPTVGLVIAFSWLAVFSTLGSERARRRDLALRIELEAANEARTRFFANVSHELRTPLTLILGPIDALRANEADPRRRDLFHVITANCRRLLRQVNALLDIAKVDARQLKLKIAKARIGDILSELVAAARPAAERRGVELVLDEVAQLPEILCDAEKVETVIANLLSNALRFTPDGGSVRVLASSDDSHVTFEVKDSGPGIPVDQQEQIFVRFHQVDGSSSRAAEGTGLGLALAKELVNLHGGAISVTSAPGTGSTFRVTLPRKPAATDGDSDTERQVAVRSHEVLLADIVPSVLHASAPSRREDRRGEVASVLLVEDNADLRAFLADQLSPFYDVEVAANGQTALELARASRPNVVVTDIMMPVMDGHALCRRVREDGTLRSTAIIMLTAKAGVDALIDGIGVGADDYIAKPFEIAELVARIEAQLRTRRTEQELREEVSAKNLRLEELSRTDPLTSVANRRFLLETLEREFGRAVRHGSALSVIMADLDSFKRLNDTHGHIVGDKALVEVAQAIKGCLRSSDLIGRYGGEEFCLVLPETELASARRVAERCRAAIEQIETVRASNGHVIKITGSFGVAGYPAYSASAVQELIDRADAAMYQAKQTGRNRTEQATV